MSTPIDEDFRNAYLAVVHLPTRAREIKRIYQAYCEERAAKVEAIERLAKVDFELEQLREEIAFDVESRAESDFLYGFRRDGAA